VSWTRRPTLGLEEKVLRCSRRAWACDESSNDGALRDSEQLDADSRERTGGGTAGRIARHQMRVKTVNYSESTMVWTGVGRHASCTFLL
jgi:hypothetical protein